MSRFPDEIGDEIRRILATTLDHYPDVMQIASKVYLSFTYNTTDLPDIVGYLWVRYRTGSDPINIISRNRVKDNYSIHKIYNLTEVGETSFSLGPWHDLFRTKNVLYNDSAISDGLRAYMDNELTIQKFSRLSYHIRVKEHSLLKHYFTNLHTQLIIENDVLHFHDRIYIGESIHKQYDDFMLNYDTRALQA